MGVKIRRNRPPLFVLVQTPPDRPLELHRFCQKTSNDVDPTEFSMVQGGRERGGGPENKVVLIDL